MNAFARAALLGVALLACASSATLAADAPPIKIGFIFSYSGGGVSVDAGNSADAAIATALREHGGAVAGRRIEIIKRDGTGWTYRQIAVIPNVRDTTEEPDRQAAQRRVNAAVITVPPTGAGGRPGKRRPPPFIFPDKNRKYIDLYDYKFVGERDAALEKVRALLDL